MTTPSKYRRLREASDLYVEYAVVAMRLCQQIKKLHGGLKFDGPDTPENEEWKSTAMAIATAIEGKFHEVLDPYVTRLEELDVAIRSNLPKAPGSIILPGEEN
jgi:hypothetical protein